VTSTNSFTITGVLVVDGSESKGFRGDVVVEGGIITAVSKKFLKSRTGSVISGDNLVLAPGFIDMHSHSDVGVIDDKAHLAKVTQGVTLEVVGQDGLSYVPANTEIQSELRSQLYGWNGPLNNVDWNFKSVSEYLSKIDEGCAVNIAYLVPHGTVRMLAKGLNPGPPTEVELNKMKNLVREGMQQGAFGLSTGLTYVPAMYADTNELIELCKVVTEFGGYYCPHHRNYGSKIFSAIEECISIALNSKIPLHLTHCHLNYPGYHGRALELINLITHGRNQGVDVSLDTYPYLAGSSYLHALLPSWIQAGGMDNLRTKLRDVQIQKQIIEALDVTGSDAAQGGTVNWDKVVISGVEQFSNKKFVGKTVSEIASTLNTRASQFYLNLCIEEDFKAGMVVFGGNEENVRTIMKDSRHMVGSDGILHGDKPHPRTYGTFAKYLGFYARQEGEITLEGAVARMTGRPAKRLGLLDRGFIRVGNKADLVLFDYNSVIDRATYESPKKPAAGFEYVWIEGWPTLANRARTGLTPGKGLRKVQN